MKIPFTYIANWKMYLTSKEAIHWINIHKSTLEKTIIKEKSTLILCPSFENLYPIKRELENTSIALGAQDCSNYAKGAYTGQVSAESLREIGCSYCIVGHSERRSYQQESNQIVAQKIEQLLANKIIPILCIGEDKKAYDAGLTEKVIQEQLATIASLIKKTTQTDLPFFIAYEPIWSIGTGLIPDNNYLEEVFSFIKNYTKNWPNYDKITFLYGGSVNTSNCTILAKVKAIQGFLIGSASKDIQELKSIIELMS